MEYFYEYSFPKKMKWDKLSITIPNLFSFLYNHLPRTFIFTKLQCYEFFYFLLPTPIYIKNWQLQTCWNPWLTLRVQFDFHLVIKTKLWQQYSRRPQDGDVALLKKKKNFNYKIKYIMQTSRKWNSLTPLQERI